MLQRLFWALLVLGSTGAMTYQVYERLAAYFEYQSSTDISIQFESVVEFPAVTICNFNRFFDPDSDRQLERIHLLNQITSPAYYLLISHEGRGAFADEVHAFHPNFSVTNFFSRKGYMWRDNEELLVCRFRSSTCNATHFNQVLTQMGMCYTFNHEPSSDLVQSTVGPGQGLHLVVNTLHEYYTEEAFFGVQEAGIRFQIHPKHEPPNVLKYGIAVPVGRKGFASTRRLDQSIMYQPWGVCNPQSEKSLKYFANYTLQACLRECHTDLLIKECGCRAYYQYWAAGYADECSVREIATCATPYIEYMENNYGARNCSCFSPCQFTEYRTTISYATSPSLAVESHFETSFNLVDGNDTGGDVTFASQHLVTLDIGFDFIGYETLTQSKKIDASSLFSDIGGQLGLWIGMSLITLAEFGQYFIARIALWVVGSRIKRGKGDCKVSDYP